MKKLTLNTDEPIISVKVQNIRYVNPDPTFPEEVEIEIEQSFVDEGETTEEKQDLIEQVIYEDLETNFGEVIDFEII